MFPAPAAASVTGVVRAAPAVRSKVGERGRERCARPRPLQKAAPRVAKKVRPVCGTVSCARPYSEPTGTL